MKEVNDLIYRLSLSNKEECNLSEFNLSEFPEALFELSKLKSLNLIRCNLTSIPPDISKLKSLEKLYLSGNALTQLPEELGLLDNLKTVVVNNCQLEELPKSIGNLSKLEFLDVRDNKLSKLPYELGKCQKLKNLYVSGNALSDIAPEILAQSTIVILDYLKSKLEGDVIKLFEAKLIIVGEGEVGKTWLKERLIYDKIRSTESGNSTEGIDISKWVIKTPVTDKFRINIWDFGGQEIYHSTHQFFLTERSLYLLVFDARKDYDVLSFRYWLNTIQLLSVNSPVIIVLNKMDERIKNIDYVGLKERFPSIVGFVKVSAFTGEGRIELTNIIEQNIVYLKHVGQILPKNWVAVREQLEALNLNFISYDKYILICNENNVDEEVARDLSQYYHILGVFLHFPDNPVLKGIVFLNPTWATTAVYRILDTKTVQLNYGKFSFGQLYDIWQRKFGYPEENYVHLLELMKKFELCFQLPNSNWYIVPELLPSTKPQFQWDNTDNLRFEIRYDFMPAGVFTRFIVRIHESVKENLFWKTGVLLEETTIVQSMSEDESIRTYVTNALVTSSEFDRKILILIRGNEKRELLSLIRRQLHSIHKSLRNPSFSEIITCCCEECNIDNNAEQIEFDRIRQYHNKQVESFPCPKSGKPVSVSKLMGDFELTNESLKREFLSLLKKIRDEEDSDKSFLAKAKELLILQPNFMGLGINFNRLFEQMIGNK